LNHSAQAAIEAAAKAADAAARRGLIKKSSTNMFPLKNILV
jgi:ribosomal protein S20